MLPSNSVSQHVVHFWERTRHLGKPDGNTSKQTADPPSSTRPSDLSLLSIMVHWFTHKKEMYRSREQSVELHLLLYSRKHQEQRLFGYIFPRQMPCYPVHQGLAALPGETSPAGSCTDRSQTAGLLLVFHATGWGPQKLPSSSDAEQVHSRREAYTLLFSIQTAPVANQHRSLFTSSNTAVSLFSLKDYPIFHER